MEDKALRGGGFFRNWWLSVSIRRKMLIFIGLVVFMVLFITLFSAGMVGFSMRDFNVVLGDSYAVNQVLGSFEAEDAAFREYANKRTAEQRTSYAAARRVTATDIKALRFAYSEMSVDRYLLTQAIRVIYETYDEKCTRTLLFARESEAYIKEYYTADKVSGYMVGYIKELTRATLEEGNENYKSKIRLFTILPAAAVVLGLLIIGFAALLCTITVRHIINPVLKLAGAAREISAGRLDLPDVWVTNRDEIGEMVGVFNTMKRSMSSSLIALQEKGEMESRLHQEEVHRINTEQELKTMQMSLLQSQINPHFLFNTLNTVSRMAKVEGAVNTEELIQRLASLFRYNLQTASERVSLTRELNIINDYIYIQHRRFGNRIGFEVDCRLDADKIMIPTFTLQPLVENAVIHGVSPQERGGRIRIRIRGDECGGVTLTVTDTGQGMPPARLNALMNAKNHKGHVSGIGVGNVRTRVELLYAGSRFHIFSRVGLGTAIRIVLPACAELGETEDQHV